MGAILRRSPQVGENNFPLPWIPENQASSAGAVVTSAATVVGSQTSLPSAIDSSSPSTAGPADGRSSTYSSASPTSTQIVYGHDGHGASNKSLALAVTVPLGIALVLGIIAAILLNRWRKPSRPRNNSSSTASSRPIWREKFGLLHRNSTSTSSSSASSVISGPISTASPNHPYYTSPDRSHNNHQEQQSTEQSQPQEPRTEPGTVIFEAPPPPYIKEPAPELPNLPAGLARLSYQHPPAPPTRPVSELRISVQMANALRISAQSIGFPSLGSLPVSEEPPAHPPLPEDLGRWSYPSKQAALAAQAGQELPASPEVDELRNSTLARFPVPPSVPAVSERRPHTPTLQNLTVPQMQKMQYRNMSPELVSPTSPESPVWGHGFPDLHPSLSVRSFTSTLYSDTASVHSAHAARLSARPTPVVAQGHGFFGDGRRSPGMAY